MTQHEVLTLADYAEVRNQVQAAIDAGRQRVERETLRTYWEVGGILRGRLDQGDAAYGKGLVSRLAEDLGIGGSLLYDAVALRRRFPNFHTCGNLTWSQCRKLVHVNDSDAMHYYALAAVDESWNTAELSAAISRDEFGRLSPEPRDAVGPESGIQSPASDSITLQARRGDLFVHRIAEKHGKRVLDLGFRAFHPLVADEASSFDVGDLVRSVRDRRSRSGFRYEDHDARRRVFAFRARVSRLIDGDTLWATVDCGFDTWIDLKLRLRGIDTPELGSSSGVTALSFVRDQLADSRIVVTTTKVDLYDRYLTDIYYLKGEPPWDRVAADGLFLNRQLVESGHARLWTKEKTVPEW